MRSVKLWDHTHKRGGGQTDACSAATLASESVSSALMDFSAEVLSKDAVREAAHFQTLFLLLWILLRMENDPVMWNKPALVLWHRRPKCVPWLGLWRHGDENTWSVNLKRLNGESRSAPQSGPLLPFLLRRPTVSEVCPLFCTCVHPVFLTEDWFFPTGFSPECIGNDLQFNETFSETRWWSKSALMNLN